MYFMLSAVIGLPSSLLNVYGTHYLWKLIIWMLLYVIEGVSGRPV